MVKISTYEALHLPGVHALYSELTIGQVPHCWSVTPALLEVSLQESSVEREWAELLEQRVLVALDDGDVAGFIHLGHQAANKWSDAYGVIRFLAIAEGSATWVTPCSRLQRRGCRRLVSNRAR